MRRMSCSRRQAEATHHQRKRVKERKEDTTTICSRLARPSAQTNKGPPAFPARSLPSFLHCYRGPEKQLLAR